MKSWKDYKAEYAGKSEQSAAEIAVMEELAEIISAYVSTREEKGITQSELAELAGIKQSALSRMESMKAIPQLDTMIKALKPLGLTLKIASES